MRNWQDFFNRVAEYAKQYLLQPLTLKAMALTILISMTGVQTQGAAAADSNGMNMDMDHSAHQHPMEHAGHEQHIGIKPGITQRSVETYTIPNIKLIDTNGGEIALSEVFKSDAPIILNFIFTSCTTICPVMSASFQQVQQQLGPKRSNVRLVSISIDPENDTPAKLKEYAEKLNAGPHWKLLTGSLENSIAVQRAFGVYAGDKMNHKPLTFLKAKKSEKSWVRLEGLSDAKGIISELDKLAAK